MAQRTGVPAGRSVADLSPAFRRTRTTEQAAWVTQCSLTDPRSIQLQLAPARGSKVVAKPENIVAVLGCRMAEKDPRERGHDCAREGRIVPVGNWWPGSRCSR